MLGLRYSLSALLASVGCSVATSNGSSPGIYPWQWAGPHQDAGYWFDEFQDTLATMQSPTFWNGTYWPATIQWIGAFLNTLVAASDRSLANTLEDYNESAHTSPTSIHAEIQKYFSDIEAYYSAEDVIQIFGAAYDDAQWVVLEWLEAINFINQYAAAYAPSSLGQADLARFAHRAHIFYNIVQNQFDTSLCGGGLTWNPALAPYKNAITNELFISSSVGMYLYYPGDDNSDPYPSSNYVNATNATLPALPPLAAHDPLLLANAVNAYAWFQTHNFTNAQGLVVDGFHVSVDQTTCDERDEMVYTYNQGVMLSGLRQLWEATGDTAYLADGYAYVETVIKATGWYARSQAVQAARWGGLGRNGVMEDYCDAPANCTQDAQAFKGIYFHHLALFCEPLPTTHALVPNLTYLAGPTLSSYHAAKCASYTPWIQHNAHAALSTRNKTGVVGGWWGASYVHSEQGEGLAYAVPIPSGSGDVWNEPWVLGQKPWVCEGWHCREGGQGSRLADNGKRMAGLFGKRRRDVNDKGRGRTVETEGSGLGVVKAASDFTGKRKAS